MITIKPHHYIDIIKLYGAGIEEFVPDEKYKHAFYKVANEIIKNGNARLRFTLDGDDVCAGCIYNSAANHCTDGISSIPGYSSKELYNKLLDKRLVEELQLDFTAEYASANFCKTVFEKKGMIERVWDLENEQAAQRRSALLLCGCSKYLYKNNMPTGV